MGYGYEVSNLEDIANHYRVAYHNPKVFCQWLRTKGHGIDLELKVVNRNGYEYRIFIEESFCSKPYCYRTEWFIESRLKRFEGLPHDRFNIWAVLTNRPSNFENVLQLSYKNRVKVFNYSQLLNYLSRLTNSSFYTHYTKPYTILDTNNETTNTSKNVYSDVSELIDNLDIKQCESFLESVKPCEALESG